MVWFFRLLLFGVIFALIRFIANRIFPGRFAPRPPVDGAASSSNVQPTSGKMVRDPECGMYLAIPLAVQAKSQGETLYFCSEECRHKYFAKAVTT